MGTYTNFVFDATLKQDTPAQLLDYIRHRLSSNGPFLERIPFDDHPFFFCNRWDWVLTWHNCNGNGFKAWCKDTDAGLVIHIDTELKNYCNSIEWFLLWIAPMVNLEHPCTMYKLIEGSEDDEYTEDCSDLIRSIKQRVVITAEQIPDFLSGIQISVV